MFSKIIEKILNAKLSNFFKNALYENQYGFQSCISTTHAMLDVVTFFSDNIDNLSYAGLAFVDLRNVFVTVAQEILLEELSN